MLDVLYVFFLYLHTYINNPKESPCCEGEHVKEEKAFSVLYIASLEFSQTILDSLEAKYENYGICYLWNYLYEEPNVSYSLSQLFFALLLRCFRCIYIHSTQYQCIGCNQAVHGNINASNRVVDLLPL